MSSQRAGSMMLPYNVHLVLRLLQQVERNHLQLLLRSHNRQQAVRAREACGPPLPANPSKLGP